MACVLLVYEANFIRSSLQASFLKLTMLFEARSCDMDLLYLYVPLQLLKSRQVPLN